MGILWFCGNLVCFVEAMIMKAMLLGSSCFKGASFDPFRIDRVAFIVPSFELKYVVRNFVDAVRWLRLVGRFRGGVQEIIHGYDLFLSQAVLFADLCLFRSQVL